MEQRLKLLQQSFLPNPSDSYLQCAELNWLTLITLDLCMLTHCERDIAGHYLRNIGLSEAIRPGPSFIMI